MNCIKNTENSFSNFEEKNFDEQQMNINIQFNQYENNLKKNLSEYNNFELQQRNHSDNFDATTVNKIDGEIYFKSNPIL